MHGESDRQYYRQRAATERQKEKAAVDPKIARIHGEMADCYAEKARITDNVGLQLVASN